MTAWTTSTDFYCSALFIWWWWWWLRQGFTMCYWLAWNLLYRTDWTRTHRDSTASASQGLGWKVYATMPSWLILKSNVCTKFDELMTNFILLALSLLLSITSANYEFYVFNVSTNCNYVIFFRSGPVSFHRALPAVAVSQFWAQAVPALPYTFMTLTVWPSILQCSWFFSLRH